MTRTANSFISRTIGQPFLSFVWQPGKEGPYDPITLVKRMDFRLELNSRDGVQIQTKIVKFISLPFPFTSKRQPDLTPQ